MKTQAVNLGNWIAIFVALSLTAALPALSAPKAHQQGSAAASPATPKNVAKASQPGDGEQKFKQNCSRCHEAPQAISPHISGTIVRHMRVRASLSEQDERDILKFLNP